MRRTAIILVALVLLPFVFWKRPGRNSADSSLQTDTEFKWWQKLLRILAVLMVVFIIINPEFLALGLLGDSVFIDLLIVAISLRLESVLVQFRHILHTCSSYVKWRMACGASLVLWTIVLSYDALVSTVQKITHRICS